MTCPAPFVIAQLPEPGGYFSLGKWIVMLIGIVLWLAVCQWVDKDSWRLHYKRFTWNGVVVGAGLAGAVLWLVIPLFIIGLLFDVLIVGTAAGIYVYLRNRLVGDSSKVLTADHLRHLFRRQLPERKVAPAPVVLLTADRQPAPPLDPNDPLYEGYLAGQEVLGNALAQRAEMVIITPTGRGISVQFAIDGVVSNAAAMDRRSADLIIAYLKRMAGLDVNDRRRPQTGRLTVEDPARPVPPEVQAAGYRAPEVLAARSIVAELRTSGSRAGETLRMRLTDQSEPLALDRLGLSERQLEVLAGFRKSANGVVILGSADQIGSTTTFYMALRAHDAFMTNIQTLEQAPEEELENITQHACPADGPAPAGTAAGQSASEQGFARQLQSIIRRGPDVVGVSLCKDKETARMIAQSAGGQIKFYVEMSGKDAFTLLARWAALVGDMKPAMDPLVAVFAQTLVRRLCPACKEAYRPDPQLLRKINLPADRIERLYRPPTQVPADKQGNPILCPLCQGSGYLGRTGVFESLVIDEELRRLVVNNASANEIKKYCRAQKMLYLQEEALRKVIAGQTSINEVLRVFRDSKTP